MQSSHFQMSYFSVYSVIIKFPFEGFKSSGCSAWIKVISGYLILNSIISYSILNSIIPNIKVANKIMLLPC